MNNKITLLGILIITSIIIISSQLSPNVFAITNEGNYKTFSLIQNHTTSYAFASHPGYTRLSDTGSVLFSDSQYNYIFLLNGVNKFFLPSITSPVTTQYLDQSETGMYRVILDNNGTNSIYIYKNDILLQQININSNEFQYDDISQLSISISPAAKYITIIGPSLDGYYKIMTYQGA